MAIKVFSLSLIKIKQNTRCEQWTGNVSFKTQSNDGIKWSKKKKHEKPPNGFQHALHRSFAF